MPHQPIQALDGFTFDSYMAVPESGTGPGLIVVHDIFGINETMRRRCDFYAQNGFVAICPDLFARQAMPPYEESELDKAARLYKNFDVEAGVRDLLATLACFRKIQSGNGKVGVLGHCLGGRMAFLMATRSDVDCAVGYDNVGIDTFLDEIYDIRMPLLLHFGEQDKLMPSTSRARLLRALSKNPVIQTQIYTGADHGFSVSDSTKYQPECAKVAQERTLAFFNEYLKN